MIRRGRWKLVHSLEDPDELYDLAVDPLERANLAADPEHRERVRALRAEVARRWDLAALDAAVRESQKRRHLVAATLSIGTPAPWDYQPRRDASREYVRNTLALDDIEANHEALAQHGEVAASDKVKSHLAAREAEQPAPSMWRRREKQKT